VERAGVRALFTGDVVQHLSPATPNPLGTYAARLAPMFRGSARDYRASLVRLRAIPAPDLVLPGHPRMDHRPQNPRLSVAHWHRLLDDGIAEMDQVLARFAADGEDFLDGTPKELLPGLHYLGDAGGMAVYAAVAPGGVFLFDAPAGVAELVAERAKGLRWPGPPAAVVLTSARPEAVAGLESLVRASGCKVYAPATEVEAVRKACPDGTTVLPAADLAAAGAFDVTVVPLPAHGRGPTAYRLRWARKTVLVSGHVPRTLSNGDVALDLLREVTAAPGGPDAYLRAIALLAFQSPDLWLPAVPVHGQNANLYDRDWETVLGPNRELFGR
jgi:hypothetical protein